MQAYSADGAAHQSVEVQQHVALPREADLGLRGAVGLNGVTEDEDWLVPLALLVLCDDVRARPWGGGRGEAVPERARAIVDNERRVLVAMRPVVIYVRRRCICCVRGELSDLVHKT